ncbi:MAG: thermonuclease family protein [bacterium]|nr:thermonuclease family protein [bacterium]
MNFLKLSLFSIFIVIGFVSFLFQTGKVQTGKINFLLFGDNLEKITAVLDGDTVVLENGKEIRYLGINTTEKEQPYTEEAADFNRNLVLGKMVRLELDVENEDRYGRLLAYVWKNGELINQKIIESGLAISVGTQPDTKYQYLFDQAQETAKNNCLGIWEGLCEKERCVKIANVEKNYQGREKKNKNNEWIELENFCGRKISLDKWLLKDNSSSNFYIFGGVDLLANAKLFLYSGCGKNSDKKLYWQCPEREYSVWNNSGDQAFLFDEKGLLADYFAY